jgi:hypothetical protein
MPKMRAPRNRRQSLVSQASVKHAYCLIVRGADNRPRFERFGNAKAYRARLAALHPSNAGSLTIDDVVSWLESSSPSTREDEPA